LILFKLTEILKLLPLDVIFKAKMHQFRFWLGLLAGFKGPTSKGREGRKTQRKGNGGERKGKGRVGKGREKGCVMAVRGMDAPTGH